ncbi:MAG: hypothetical protein ACU0CI_06775 [Shimia sp.]
MAHYPKRHLGLSPQGGVRLRRLAAETGLSEEEALSFLLEHLDAVIEGEAWEANLSRFKRKVAAERSR